MVPVFVKYSIATDFSPGATFQVEGLVQLESVATGSDSTICALSSFSSTSCFSTEVPSGPLRFGKTIEFQPGVVEDVGLNAAISFVSSQSSFDGDVIIDPTFTIDPAFLELNPGYSLQFSLGIGDSSTAVPTPVPEPATWTMMLLGFGGLGAAMSVARHSRGFRRSALGSAVVTKY